MEKTEILNKPLHSVSATNLGSLNRNNSPHPKSSKSLSSFPSSLSPTPNYYKNNNNSRRTPPSTPSPPNQTSVLHKYSLKTSPPSPVPSSTSTSQSPRPTDSLIKIHTNKSHSGGPAKFPAQANNKSSPRNSKLRLKICDVLTSLFIIFPITIGFWRGVWQLMDEYSKELGGPWLSIFLGNGIILALYYFQEPLKKLIHPKRMNFLAFYIVTRILLLVHSFGSVNQWRGLWELMNEETEDGFATSSAMTSLVIGVLVALCLKIFGNVLAPPLVVSIDEVKTIHTYPIRFKTGWVHDSRWMFLCDCFYSVAIIQALVILCWRGFWNLTDIYLYPDDAMLSSLVSLGIGCTLLFLLCLLQPFYYKILIQSKGLNRLAIFDSFSVLGFICCVQAWRGLWGLYDLLIVFETKLLSEWLTTVIGIIGSLLFGCISSVAARGVTVDGEIDSTTKWPFSYVSQLHNLCEAVPLPEPWLFRSIFANQPTLLHGKRGGNYPLTSPLTIANASKPLTYPGLRNIDSDDDDDELDESGSILAQKGQHEKKVLTQNHQL